MTFWRRISNSSRRQGEGKVTETCLSPSQFCLVVSQDYGCAGAPVLTSMEVKYNDGEITSGFSLTEAMRRTDESLCLHVPLSSFQRNMSRYNNLLG